MQHLNKQLTAIASILIFSIGLMLSSNVFAGKPADKTFVTQAEFDAAIDLLNTRYAIGDTGPAGGIVFYVTALGYHGLEAALEDQGLIAQWGCYAVEIPGADGKAVGTGAQNTAEILLGCVSAGIAADLADDYTLNGFDDWFLPSKDELYQLYLNKTIVGGFASGFYWSSSEYSSNLAYLQDFVDGLQGISSKFYLRNVRAVRAF